MPRCKLRYYGINPLNAELNPICHLLALLGAHHIFHVSGIRVNLITAMPQHVMRSRIALCVVQYSQNREKYEGKSIIIRTVCFIFRKQGQRSYSYIIVQHSPLALQCTLSITAQSALWPQNKKFWAERHATHAPLHPVAGLW